MRPFQELLVWQKAHAIVLEVYALSHSFPAAERFGLQGQIRRAAASVPANIAEGSARASSAEFAQFLNIALGSASELEYHLILARDLAYLTTDQQETLDARLAEVKRMLVTLERRVRLAPGPNRSVDGSRRDQQLTARSQ